MDNNIKDKISVIDFHCRAFLWRAAWWAVFGYHFCWWLLSRRVVNQFVLQLLVNNWFTDCYKGTLMSKKFNQRNLLNRGLVKIPGAYTATELYGFCLIHLSKNLIQIMRLREYNHHYPSYITIFQHPGTYCLHTTTDQDREEPVINLLKWDRYSNEVRNTKRIKMISEWERQTRRLTYVRLAGIREHSIAEGWGRGWPFFWSLNKMWQFVQRIITATKGRSVGYSCTECPSTTSSPAMLWHPQSSMSMSGFLSLSSLPRRRIYT